MKIDCQKSIEWHILSDFIFGNLNHLILTAKIRVKIRPKGVSSIDNVYRILLKRLTTLKGHNLTACFFNFYPNSTLLFTTFYNNFDPKFTLLQKIVSVAYF